MLKFQLFFAKLQHLNTHTIDNFFFDGQAGFIHHDVLFYEDIINEIVRSSNFNFYNKTLEKKFLAFYNAWQASLAYDNDFVLLPDLWTSKFSAHDKSGPERFEAFARDLRVAESAYRAFIKFVQNNYFELDIHETDKVSRKAFLEYKAEHNFSVRRKSNTKTGTKKKKQS